MTAVMNIITTAHYCLEVLKPLLRIGAKSHLTDGALRELSPFIRWMVSIISVRCTCVSLKANTAPGKVGS